MTIRRDRFLFSTEEECLTASPENPEQIGSSIEQFLSTGSRQAPSLPGPSGYFNAYGRVYPDIGHLELAATECDDPYLLASVVERQHMLAARAVAAMKKKGRRLLLANNNHSGLLQRHCPVWGSHENYLTEQHPSEFGDRILPFLVTRIYAGAGGVLFPSGDFLAGSRPLCMELATGGDTTSRRALHSTAREEHHMGSSSGCYRYHQILGDGHRSHFNLALQFGATALALKAVIFDEQLPRRLAKEVPEFPPRRADWVGLLRRLNVLARPGQSPAVHPLVVKTQHVYLESARQFVETLDDVPPWIPRQLDDWQQTIDALNQGNHAWLSARLDSFIKYELYTNFLQQAGASWQDLPNDQELFNRLALLDHSYHEFGNPDSVFRRLEEAGVLQHRVGQVPQPGEEPEPYIVETSPRARARARFIRDHQNQTGLLVDWSCVHNVHDGRWLELDDPFAKSYGAWRNGGPRRQLPPDIRRLRWQAMLDQVRPAEEWDE